jgi:hypothetical protein
MSRVYKLIVIFTLFATIFSCDKIKELATLSISTKFETDFPISITAASATNSDIVALNAALTNFVISEEIRIQDNFDLEPYLKKIKEIDLNSVVITVSGLAPGQIIQSVSLSVTEIGNILTINNITMENNSFSPTVPKALLDQVAAKLLNDKKIVVTLEGSATAPLTGIIKLAIDAKVVAYILN